MSNWLILSTCLRTLHILLTFSKYSSVIFLSYILIISPLLQVEVEEDPAEAKKDEQDEKAEVLFSTGLAGFSVISNTCSMPFPRTILLLIMVNFCSFFIAEEEENQDCC